MTRTTSYGRKSRDEAQKDLSHSEKEPTKGHPESLNQAESAHVLATKRLHLQAETAQSRNIIMELDLDGDHIQWVNYTWRVVVGNKPDELFEAQISCRSLCLGMGEP
ncbi:hypothetical protein JAAARDRAFT_195062 [Jaapia argillacea MUCL 33604]|uniref:Uncharacterized protein n=1 Tax=Jaapia argillacea MUCL 33604 TaxID=933084 RepID=A0A067PRI2_9AGAM|nr:hypothetical protein JAAARDRAFT_195062 [Jaapia argillacea MUCL 33604]